MQELKRKRIRLRPNVRWAPDETILLLEKLKEDLPNFEKPTAQVFYRKLVTACPPLHKFQWNHVRFKMRNFKIQYNKAREWRIQTGQMLDANTLRDYTLRLCPHWDSLHEILADRHTATTIATPSHVYQSDNSTGVYATSTEPHFIKAEEFDEDETRNYCDRMRPVSPSANNVDALHQYLAPRCNTHSNDMTPGHAASSAPNGLGRSTGAPNVAGPDEARSRLLPSIAEDTQMRFQRDRLDAELAIHRDKMSLEREKLLMQRNKFRMRMEYKQTKLRMEERLRLLEIEKDERLARYELELKHTTNELR